RSDIWAMRGCRRFGWGVGPGTDRAVQQPAVLPRGGRARWQEVHVGDVELVHRAYVQQIHRPDQTSRQRDVGSQREAEIPGKAEGRIEVVDLDAIGRARHTAGRL